MAQRSVAVTGEERRVFVKPSGLSNFEFPYCPGCGHGVVHRIIAEAIGELGITERTVMVSSIGCTARIWRLFGEIDLCQAAHGRAPAVASGISRSLPESVVFTYQGDGDLAAIGTAEVIHAACRGERIAVFCVNNAIFGMTGGQMAPTTLPDQVTTTSPKGRKVEQTGYPLDMCAILDTLAAPVYIERVSLAGVANLRRAEKATRKALEIQKEGRGFAMVEFLAPCPSGWHMTPLEAHQWIESAMVKQFPLRVFRG